MLRSFNPQQPDGSRLGQEEHAFSGKGRMRGIALAAAVV